MGGNHQKLRENSGKMILKILYEPWCMVCSENDFGESIFKKHNTVHLTVFSYKVPTLLVGNWVDQYL